MRYDYVKAAWKLEHDVAQQMASQWYAIFQPDLNDKEAPRTANVRSVRKEDGDKYLFIFEAWGERCNDVYNLPWETWYDKIERLDIREDIVLTRDGVDRMYQHLRENKAGSKNITMYDSRARSKRQGRDTGGYGIGIGSHKSDLRSTFYVRGHSQGAYEFQCSGVKLHNTINSANLLKGTKHAMNDAALWDNLSLAIWASGWSDVQKTFGIGQDDIVALCKGDDVQTLTLEGQLAAIDALLDSIPRDALMSVVESVQLRLT